METNTFKLPASLWDFIQFNWQIFEFMVYTRHYAGFWGNKTASLLFQLRQIHSSQIFSTLPKSFKSSPYSFFLSISSPSTDIAGTIFKT